MRDLLVFALPAVYLCVYVVVSRFLLLMFNAGGGLRFFIVSLSISFLFSTAKKKAHQNRMHIRGYKTIDKLTSLIRITTVCGCIFRPPLVRSLVSQPCKVL